MNPYQMKKPKNGGKKRNNSNQTKTRKKGGKKRNIFDRDDSELVDEEMDRELQRIRPYKMMMMMMMKHKRNRGDDRQLVEEELDRELRRIRPYKMTMKRKRGGKRGKTVDVGEMNPYQMPKKGGKKRHNNIFDLDDRA